MGTTIKFVVLFIIDIIIAFSGFLFGGILSQIYAEVVIF